MLDTEKASHQKVEFRCAATRILIDFHCFNSAHALFAGQLFIGNKTMPKRGAVALLSRATMFEPTIFADIHHRQRWILGSLESIGFIRIERRSC